MAYPVSSSPQSSALCLRSQLWPDAVGLLRCRPTIFWTIDDASVGAAGMFLLFSLLFLFADRGWLFRPSTVQHASARSADGLDGFVDAVFAKRELAVVALALSDLVRLSYCSLSRRRMGDSLSQVT
jgi:hypothetical protein